MMIMAETGMAGSVSGFRTIDIPAELFLDI